MSLNQLPPPSGVVMSPAPTDQEAAAILAATEALWPKPVVLAPAEPHREARAWRFSGRWWSKPLPARRNRPYR